MRQSGGRRGTIRVVLPYAASLRVYEPLAAFPEPARSQWARYVDLPDRPRRAHALEAEHAEAIRRLLGVPPIPVPEHESRDAYLRRVDDILYVCPWETRLRSWLAFARFRGSIPAKLANRFVPPAIAEQTADDFDRYRREVGAEGLRPHIRTSTWHVPTAWFVPFDSAERWLVLGDREQTSGEPGTATTTTPARNLLYVTSMAQARRRVARALAVLRRHVGRRMGDVTAIHQVEDVGRWLEEFHPHSLVELDYGGLVHLMDDETLRTDQSVAELAAALTGLDTGQEELAYAMYQRVVHRWRSIQALETAN